MPKPTRIKKTALPAAVSREEAERIVGEITELTIKRNQLAADMDAEVTAARARYETTLANAEARIDSLSDAVRDWALANPDEFGKKKSIEFLHGVIGFRTGMPRVKYLAGWTVARVIEKLASLPWGPAFLRVKQDLDKEGLIAAQAAQTIGDSELRQIGVRIDQEESFFVDPSVTELESRQIKEAA